MRSTRRRINFERADNHRRKNPETARHSPLPRQTGQAMAHHDTQSFQIPDEFRHVPPIRDNLTTQSSTAQAETVAECLCFLKAAEDPSRNPLGFNQHGVPPLERDDHIRFLKNALGEFPAAFVGLDSSRPWMVYWALLGLCLLGEDITQYRARVVKTFSPTQNAAGGLGGGQGQYSHLAGSYAAILSLAMVGSTESYSLIDRPSVWKWLGRLKQPNGGFQVCESGEEDVRGAYCALVLISLLDLPPHLPADAPARLSGMRHFYDGLGEYLSRCQTYEGGISGAPGNEAHGAYAFCTLACLCLLDQPHIAIPRYLDVDALINWLSSRQYGPEGGFAGRTNKLVDTCYSHWLGNCWPLLQAAIDGARHTTDISASATIGNLYSRQGLARYILSCCQAPGGGLRDKPSKRPDAYHTCYALTGLSLSQHFHYFVPPVREESVLSATQWNAVEFNHLAHSKHDSDCWEDSDVVGTVNPVYVIPHEAVKAMRQWAKNLERRDFE